MNNLSVVFKLALQKSLFHYKEWLMNAFYYMLLNSHHKLIDQKYFSHDNVFFAFVRSLCFKSFPLIIFSGLLLDIIDGFSTWNEVALSCPIEKFIQNCYMPVHIRTWKHNTLQLYSYKICTSYYHLPYSWIYSRS